MIQAKCGFDSIAGASGSNLLAAYGPTLLVDIGFDPDYKVSSRNVPNLPVKGLNALVDTGATESCIDNLLAKELNLPIIDKRPVAGSSGQHMANMYLAQIHIPSLRFTIYGAFAGVDLKAGGQMHSALIGRTFLQNFTMIYEGQTGTVILSKE